MDDLPLPSLLKLGAKESNGLHQYRLEGREPCVEEPVAYSWEAAQLALIPSGHHRRSECLALRNGYGGVVFAVENDGPGCAGLNVLHWRHGCSVAPNHFV